LLTARDHGKEISNGVRWFFNINTILQPLLAHLNWFISTSSQAFTLGSLRKSSRLALGAAHRRFPTAIAVASPLDGIFQVSTFVPSAEIWKRCRPSSDPPLTDDAHVSVARDVLS
jgi:hypothetical protein